jgi:hypothetical protein
VKFFKIANISFYQPNGMGFWNETLNSSK